MSYTRDFGEISARLQPAGEVTGLTFASGTITRFIALGSATQGRFGLFEWNMVARSGASDAHFRRTFSESFNVLSGTVRLFNGEQWLDARCGDFYHVPEGGIHAFRNESDAAASMLILFAPGPPRERYFEALAEIGASGRELNDEQWTELYARHDQYRAE